MKKLHNIQWLAWQPTPYNDLLFRSIANDPSVKLTVHFRYESLSSHPWSTMFPQGYRSRIYNIENKTFHIDKRIINAIIEESESIFVLSGWPGLTSKLAIVILSLLHRRFLFWTDTPKINFQENIQNKLCTVELKEYNFTYPFWHMLIRRFLYKIVFKYAFAIMATGIPGVNAIKALGCPSTKVVNLPFFVQLPDLQNRIRQKKTQSPFTFISVGQLLTKKGYDIALKAISIATNNIDIPFRYLIIGDGPDRDYLKSLIIQYDIESHVELLGWLEPEQVYCWLNSSNAFIHSARLDPYPVVVLEAMANGLPILGSDTSGSVCDRINNGVNGFIHKAGNREMLANHIMKLVSKPELSVKLGRAARSTAEQWPVEYGVKVIKNLCN